jgi:predicted ATP-dependent endonuclease of OLD family
MRIARVHIENFRSIKELDFSPGPYCVLIGENNSGKSNILRALSVTLGETWPTERLFSEEDFYNQNTDNDIVIQVFFDEVIEEWRNNFRMEIAGIELRCKAYKIKVKEKPAGTLTTDYTCINKTGKGISYPAEKLTKGTKYTGQWVPYRVTKEIREQLPFIYVDVLRDYNRQTPGSRWSVLRRLFNEVNTQFMSDKTLVKVKRPDGSSVKMTRREAFEISVKDAYKYLRTNAFNEIETKLAANAIELMGLDVNGNKVELSFESHDPINAFKSLQLYVDQMGIRSPAGEVGAGLQSAIVVAIFRTYEELKKEGAVFAIEEPEAFLHPQKARYFSTVLRSLADKGNQVFLTTHSPIFVHIHEPESVVIVRRSAETGTEAHQASKVQLAGNERQALRMMTEFDSQRNELFFARKVMFVEGNTEKVALPLVFSAMGIDINKENISVIECGGKTKIPLFVRISNALGIPNVVLADSDIQEIKEEWSDKRKETQRQKNTEHKRWNKAILDTAGKERTFWMKPSFEDALALPKEESQKIDKALERFANTNEADMPDCLKEPVRKLMGICQAKNEAQS